MVNDNYAYLAAGNAGLRVIDISNPATPQEVGFFSTPWDAQARDVAVSGTYAYLADWGLRVIDISNPAKPQEVSYYSTTGWAESVAISDGLIYVADGPGGLFILQSLQDP